jgi:hypothetical protein
LIGHIEGCVLWVCVAAFFGAELYWLIDGLAGSRRLKSFSLIWPVRLSGTEKRRKATQKSHAEVGFLSGLRPPFITVSGSEKSYRPRKLRWRQISGER